jgi:serine/threonine protein kinase
MPPQTLVPGTRLEPYEVVAPLGAAGMGEVYLARDTNLQRDAALKVLREGLAGDAGPRVRDAQFVTGFNGASAATPAAVASR